jgi:aryl-alcohol dehydrogenase-like predicted oxidoreductase
MGDAAVSSWSRGSEADEHPARLSGRGHARDMPTREPISVGDVTLPLRRLGDRDVSCIGLGCMPLSGGRMVEQRADAIALVHAALDAGVTLLDTANIYAPSWDAMGHNEALVAEALRTWEGDQDGVLVTTKGGITRGPGETWGRDGSPDGLQRAAEASREQLGVDVIELWQMHRLDPAIPAQAQFEAAASLQSAGLVRMVGLSNVTLPELEVALEVLGTPHADDRPGGGVVSVQNEFSPQYRRDADVIERCGELGIAFLPWSPLGGANRASEVGSDAAAFAEVGRARGVSPQRVALAWHLQRSAVTIPIPGSTRPATLHDSLAAATLELTAEELARLEGSAPPDGSTFPDDQPRPPLR